MNPIQSNIRLFKIDAFLGGIWPLSTLAIIYFEQITHSYALAMLVWSVANLTQTFGEIPTGIFSDKIGRRKTLMMSALTILICFILWALAGQFELMSLLFIGAFFWGLSDAFISGTNEALMYETMNELNEKGDFSTLYAKSNFWVQFGLGLSALFAAGWTYFYSLQSLAWISVFPIVGQLVTAWLFVEPKRTQQQTRTTSWTHFLIAFRRLWRNKKLRFYATISVIDEAVGFAFLRIEAGYYNTLIQTWLINIVRFVKQVSGMIGFAMAPFFKRFGSVRCFFGGLTLNELLRLVAIILNNTFSPFIMALRNMCWGVSDTAKTDILQQEFSDNQRATMQSIISLAKGIFGAVVMYLFGVIADISDPKTAVVTAMCVKIMVLIVSFIILRKGKKTNPLKMK